jgi:hypothetical protein
MWIKRLCGSLPVPDDERGRAEARGGGDGGNSGVIKHFCDWLAATPLSTAFQDWTWFVPTVQVVHIICISVIFMVVLRIAVRLLRPQRNAGTFGPFLAGQMPAIWTAMAVLLVSGTLLTITEPARELLNWAFRTKMILVLMLVGVIAGVRHATRDNADFGASGKTRVRARSVAILLMVLGVAIITAGRWIAYV